MSFATLRRLVPLLALLAAVGALASSCGGSSAAALPAGVVAEVNGTPITRSELDRFLEQVQASYKQQKQKFPDAGTPEYRDLRDRALNYLVQRTEYEQKAKEMGIEISDAQVTKRVDQFIKQQLGGNRKKFDGYLKKGKFTLPEFRDLLRIGLVSEAIFKKVTSSVTVSDKDVKDYYDQNIAQYTTDESREVRHILVKDKATADKLYKQLKAGADFAKLAKKYSTDTGTKDNGGKYTVVKGQAVPEFEKTAFDLKEGELSEPVKTEFGWHIIQALGPIKPKKVTPLEDVEATIRKTLVDNKKQTAATDWQANLSKEYAKKVKYAEGYGPPAQTQTAPTTTG